MKKLVGILVMMAAGSVAAQQNLADSTREAEVAFWTSGYAGSKLGSIGCAAPQLPEEYAPSGTRLKTMKAIHAWKECHRRLIGALAPDAAHKFIPADLLATMTPAERDAAIHVTAVHAKHADALQADAAKLIAAQQAWQVGVQRYVDDYPMRLVDASNGDTVRQNEVARRP